MNIFRNKIILFILLAVIVIFVIYYFGFSEKVTPENLRTHTSYLKEIVQERYISAVFIFIASSMALMLLMLPLTGPIAVCGGFLFGFWAGVLYTIVGVILGLALSFLVVRYVCAHLLRGKYSERLISFNNRMKQDGYMYLISLQLLAVVPYFIINTLAALAGVPLHTFLWTTIVGSLPIVMIYALAGRQLYAIQKWSDILSVPMLVVLLGLAFIAILPMILRRFKKVDDA